MSKKTTKNPKGGQRESAPKKRTVSKSKVSTPKKQRAFLREDQIEEALRKSGGFLSGAAEMLGVTVSAVSHRITDSEHLQQVRAEVEDSHLDLAESKLMKKIREEETAAIFFFLKCKGKDRGYVEKQQIEASSPDGKPLKFNIEFVGSDAAKNSDS